MSSTTNPARRRSVPAQLPNTGRATFAIFVVLFASAVDAAHGAFYGWLLAVWGTVEDTSTMEQLEGLLGFLQLVALVLGAIGFTRWFRRAYGNAIALGHRAAFTPGWAIGAWFVPFLNLVRPYQIASSMWRHAGARVGTGALVGWWWTFWLVSNFLAQIGLRMSGARSNDTMRLSVQLLIASDIATVIAGVLAVLMVRKLTRAQEAMVPESAAEVFA